MMRWIQADLSNKWGKMEYNVANNLTKAQKMDLNSLKKDKSLVI